MVKIRNIYKAKRKTKVAKRKVAKKKVTTTRKKVC